MKQTTRLCLLAILLLLTLTLAECLQRDVSVKFKKKDGSFQVLHGKELWFNSGPVFFGNNSKIYSTEDGSLRFASLRTYAGVDALGTYTAYEGAWSTTKDETVSLITSAKVYYDEPAVMFTVTFPDGLKGCALNNTNTIVSAFPSLLVEELGLERAFLSYGGNFASDVHIGGWGPYESIPGGLASGVPLVVFNSFMNKTVVISPADSFMISSQTTIQMSPLAIGYGLLGTIDSVPPMYSYKTLLVAGNNVTGTMKKWGELLRREYKKDGRYRRTDFSLNYLGYWTDHGSCYYYTTGQYSDYGQVYEDVYRSALLAHVPIRYMQLDSWWYYKGIKDGVKNWTAIESLFPNGFGPIKELTGWPVVAHNRFWSSDTDYSMSNGGNFHFIEDVDISLPNDPLFWSSLFAETKKTFDLAVYEQDWLYVQSTMPSLLRDLYQARSWLMEMGAAAVEAGLTIQYCMPWPRHLLQSLEVPAVTQARASLDYLPNNQQWRIGDTVILAHALGLAAFKDTFQSSPDEARCATVDKEKNPVLEAYMAALSGGPVGVGDAAFSFDAALLQATCMPDGRLLKTTRPAMSLDSSFVYRAFDKNGPNGPLYVAYTEIGPFTWYHILAADLSETYSLCGRELPPSGSVFPQSSVPFSVLFRHTLNGTVQYAVNFTSPDECFGVGPCGRTDFQYWTLAPVLPGSLYAFLGELRKIVTVSETRFTKFEFGADRFAIYLVGVPGEVVELAFLNIFAPSPTVVKCTIAQSGSATVFVPEFTCVSN